MTSKALEAKIRDARAAAPQEVPIAMLCANVMSALAADDEAAVEVAVAELKSVGGRYWSTVTALQFMSGQRGQFAAEAAPPEERERLLVAHRIALAYESAKAIRAAEAAEAAPLHGRKLPPT